jgi:hypothetical protein
MTGWNVCSYSILHIDPLAETVNSRESHTPQCVLLASTLALTVTGFFGAAHARRAAEQTSYRRIVQ